MKLKSKRYLFIRYSLGGLTGYVYFGKYFFLGMLGLICSNFNPKFFYDSGMDPVFNEQGFEYILFEDNPWGTLLQLFHRDDF